MPALLIYLGPALPRSPAQLLYHTRGTKVARAARAGNPRHVVLPVVLRAQLPEPRAVRQVPRAESAADAAGRTALHHEGDEQSSQWIFRYPSRRWRRWDGSGWKSWRPKSDMPIRSPLMPWACLEAAVLQDASAFVRYRSAEFFKVAKYLELQNETDPSGRLTYWKSRGFVQHPETQSEILRPSGASASIHAGAGRPTFRLTGGSRGIFVKKTILKEIHIARLRSSL